jgi:hypothetical protein
MKLWMARRQHIHVSNLFILLLLMLFQKLIKLLFPFISIDIRQSLLRIILSIMENEPPRALRQTPHKRHQ